MESVKKALLRHHQRQLGKKRRTNKNKKPEKMVEKQVVSWLKSHGFSVSVVESKAVYSKSAGRYMRGQTVQGFPDIVGCDKHGTAVFIELKAPGKLQTLRPAQYYFLLDKIKHNAFAVCVDSVELLESIYNNWDESILLEALPVPKAVRDQEACDFDLASL